MVAIGGGAGKRVARIVAAIATAAVLASCGSDSAAPLTQDSFLGTYTLRSVDGVTLPYTVPGSPYAFRIDSATMELAPEGEFAEHMYGESNLSYTYGSSLPKADRLILVDEGAWGWADNEMAFSSLLITGVNYFAPTSTSFRFVASALGASVGSTVSPHAMEWVRAH